MMVRIIAVLAAAAVLAGCSDAVAPPSGAPTSGATAAGGTPVAGSTPAATSAPSAPTRVVMVVRHAEKPDDEIPGVDVNGDEDDSSLTRVGWDRAHRLVDLFAPAEGAARPGLVRPETIYAAGANDEGEGKRTRETVAPLAEKLGVTVDTRFGKGDEEQLVEHVLARPGPTLISWQHSGIPTIAAAFPGVTPAPPEEWSEDRFDVVWIFTETAAGWNFTQLPELALPHDRPDVIED